MSQLGESPTRAEPAIGWPIDLTRGVVQVLDGAGRSVGTGFVVGPRLLVTCAHVVIGHGGDGGPPTDPITVVFAHLDGAARTARVDSQCWRDVDGADVAFLRMDELLPVSASPPTRRWRHPHHTRPVVVRPVPCCHCWSSR